jgi:hypothetical protein
MNSEMDIAARDEINAALAAEVERLRKRVAELDVTPSAERIRAEERERCAQVAQSHGCNCDANEAIAEAIRRGDK